MNNDSNPNSAEELFTTEEITSEPVGSTEPATTTRRRDASSPAQKKFKAQLVKKLEFIDGLMKNLDMLIYAELCILYYMDCSLFSLVIRFLNQLMFLTPKPQFVPPLPQHRPYIGAIFGPNIICMLLHMFTARPHAGEAMRGYLHGGIIVDLIGQKGPTSKIHLVALDLLVLVLQFAMLAVHVERERLSKMVTAYTSPTRRVDPASAVVPSIQDHDAEERGVMRDGFAENGDIELQPMASQDNDSTPAQEITTPSNDDHARLLAELPPRDERGGDGLDTFWSGRAIVVDLHILHNIRRQWADYGNATGSAFQTVGYSAALAAATTNRRLRLEAATQRLQRGVESLTT
ncbi:uncharacterized protein BP5553_06010 [Venustampulla echinocandica]|uniref:DUF1746 domain-containing protein n=1 Tax=Venustampulla echinocandica TaxID=2656787 RepID=A0A370TMB1_9HELO|nr:uncharacterized protein BP5553_06010 [Venustampulla echinocandica]RDL36658.1 hypothetical protein BP5553_06010 [Venustampulla echinocandica]